MKMLHIIIGVMLALLLFMHLVGCAARDPYISSNPKHISNYL